MIVKYGNYAFPSNSLSVSIARTALKTQGGIYYAYEETWTLSAPAPGLFDTTQSALTNEINALTSAFATDGYDLVLYLDDGVTPSAHALYSAQCNGGTRVIQPPFFPTGSGAEYSTYRTFSIVVAGEVPIVTQNIATKYHERVEIHGTGGPMVVWITTAAGPPVPQITAQQTPVTLIQSGSAEGLYGYPGIPAPILPANELLQQRRISTDSPTMRNGRYYDFPCSWSYTFMSGAAELAVPNFYPQ